MARKKTTLSDELQAQYKREVARVNKQLYRLEKHYADRPEFLAQSAYGTLMKDIKREFGEQRRFGKAMPANMAQLRKRLNMIRRFYEKPSATVAGMKKVYAKRAATFSKKFGVTITADEMKDFFENGLWQALTKEYGSAKSVKFWKTIEVQRERIMKQFEEGKKITFQGRIAADINAFVEETNFDELLREYLG